MPEITSTLADLQQLGLYSDVGDIWIAMMTTEDTQSAPPVYAAPILACETVSYEMTPSYSEGTKRASGRTIRKVKKLTGMDLKVVYPRMKADVRAMILGRTADANGGIGMSDGLPPLCAVGVCSVRDDGTKLMRWIYKCRASEEAVSAQTSEENQIAYQDQTLNFAGVPLTYETDGIGGVKEHIPGYEADTGDAGCKWKESSFFASVVGPWSEGVTG